MKHIFYSLLFVLIISACKKSSGSGNNSGNNNKPVPPEVANVVGVFQFSSFTDPNGNMLVFTPQNSPGTITVTRTNDSLFHFVLNQKLTTGGTSTASNDFVFDEISGDGYIHFNRVDRKATARYVNSVNALTVEINQPVHEIIVTLRK